MKLAARAVFGGIDFALLRGEGDIATVDALQHRCIGELLEDGEGEEDRVGFHRFACGSIGMAYGFVQYNLAASGDKDDCSVEPFGTDVGCNGSGEQGKPSAVALALKVCLLGLDRECPKADSMVRTATSRCNQPDARLSESRNGMWVGSRRVLSGCAGDAVPGYVLHTHNTACGGLPVIPKERRWKTMASPCAGLKTRQFAQGSADSHLVSADSRAVKKRV